MSRKWMAAAALLVLMLSVCVFAAAEEPTDPVYPVPGPLEKHEHTVSVKIVDRGYTAHRLHEWCPACGRLLKERLEGHNFVDGVCTVCDWECPHPPEAAEKHYERDGVKPQWDGNYIIGPGWEITECGVCHTELSRVETTVREFHNIHTHFTPVLECLPHDADTHALIRYCDECGTEVPEYVPHNCPPSDRPYTDEGDPDTHSRLVRCADCGFWVPQQQAHTWVHDSYKKDETDGGGEGHIEVMKCAVCGAKKEVKQLHDAGTHVSYRQDGNTVYHIEVRQCTLCGDRFEIRTEHDLEHVSYRNDGNTQTHIDVQVCILCGQEVAEKRVGHISFYATSEKISETHHANIMRCNVCGLDCVGKYPQIHHFETGYRPNNKESHYVYDYCHDCGMEKNFRTEAHTWDGVNCSKCGEVKEGHQHIADPKFGSNYEPLNADQHIVYYHCKAVFTLSCKSPIAGDPEPHTFDPLTMTCTKCRYRKEACQHQYAYKPVRFGLTADEHTLIGTCTKCGKEITVTGAHDMKFFSKSDYRPCENGHTFTVTERCTDCGYEMRHTETENHVFSTGESISPQEHRAVCSLCGYGIAEPHTFVCTSDNMAHVCSICGEKGEHDYLFAEYRCDGAWIYHTCVYQCSVCMHEKGERQEHPVETLYEPDDDAKHFETIWCPLCGIITTLCCDHEFDESGTCVCGYHRGDPVSEAPLSQEGLTEDSGDETVITPVFCHLAADGNEMPFGYELILSDEVVSENGKAFNFIILPESISGDAVIEIRFTASEVALLRAFGVKSVYIRPGENDILLLDDVSQALTALTEQEIAELVITLTPGSDGTYATQYDPAGVYITE